MDNEIIARSELRRPDELECVEVKLEIMLIDPRENGATMLWEIEGQKYSYDLDDYEAAMLSFVRIGCSVMSHIKTAHQIALETHQQYGTILETATIEAKQGDVLYARLGWRDSRGRRFFNICSIADAMIYHDLAPGSKLQIVRNVLDTLEIYEQDWDSSQEIMED